MGVLTCGFGTQEADNISATPNLIGNQLHTLGKELPHPGAPYFWCWASQLSSAPGDKGNSRKRRWFCAYSGGGRSEGSRFLLAHPDRGKGVCSRR
jgi:hypothetical protein